MKGELSSPGGEKRERDGRGKDGWRRGQENVKERKSGKEGGSKEDRRKNGRKELNRIKYNAW